MQGLVHTSLAAPRFQWPSGVKLSGPLNILWTLAVSITGILWRIGSNNTSVNDQRSYTGTSYTLPKSIFIIKNAHGTWNKEKMTDLVLLFDNFLKIKTFVSEINTNSHKKSCNTIIIYEIHQEILNICELNPLRK